MAHFNDMETTLKEDKCFILDVTIPLKKNKHKIGGFNEFFCKEEWVFQEQANIEIR